MKGKNHSRIFSMLLTEQEWEELKKTSSEYHMTASAYCRYKIFTERGD